MSDEVEEFPEVSAALSSKQYSDALIVEREHHCISRRAIPESVLKVLYRLHRSGYRAFLCGGSVRDLLMNRTPKDFDIATDAHPMDIRRLFRNSRIIGRRFRLVHVMFQDRVLEVSTFRREPEKIPEGELLVTDDNTFGNPREDARRRDFTINGLFYNIADFSIIDYVGGLHDLNDRLIRVIGDPDLRFREDPVRMLRAVEFAARLDFEIEAQTYDAIIRHRTDILKASAPRVSEEILDLLRRGWSLDAMELLVETTLMEPLLPELFNPLSRGKVSYFWKMLEVLDRTVKSGRSVSDAVFLSVLFLPFVLEELEREETRRGTRLRSADVLFVIRELIEPVCARMTLSAGIRHQSEQSLELLWRLFEPPSDRRAMFRFIFREQFTDALSLLELYALSSGKYVETFRQWQQFAGKVKKEEGGTNGPPVRKRRRRR
ncbi:MAG TPA: polynucleotide adenylyltransferase PcnB [Thermoanaerobaculia bacterium]|nr:polynucleotide adenylyltransferase PcnB [Thermoanaerobaculia bacterium]